MGFQPSTIRNPHADTDAEPTAGVRVRPRPDLAFARPATGWLTFPEALSLPPATYSTAPPLVPEVRPFRLSEYFERSRRGESHRSRPRGGTDGRVCHLDGRGFAECRIPAETSTSRITVPIG